MKRTETKTCVRKLYKRPTIDVIVSSFSQMLLAGSGEYIGVGNNYDGNEEVLSHTLWDDEYEDF